MLFVIIGFSRWAIFASASKHVISSPLGACNGRVCKADAAHPNKRPGENERELQAFFQYKLAILGRNAALEELLGVLDSQGLSDLVHLT
jgi:hypothetical protein